MTRINPELIKMPEIQELLTNPLPTQGQIDEESQMAHATLKRLEQSTPYGHRQWLDLIIYQQRQIDYLMRVISGQPNGRAVDFQVIRDDFRKLSNG